MSEPSTGGAPSAEAMKQRLEEIEREKNLGAGDKEPDPATAENPPSDMQAGNKAREQS